MIDYFEDIEQMRKYAQGVEASFLEENIYPSFMLAKKKIINSISEKVYDKILELQKDTEIQEPVKIALANFIMYEYIMFHNSSKGKEDKLYKYEYEAIREQYISTAYDAMDVLIDLLDSKEGVPEWKEAEYCKQRKDLLIKSAADFEYYYAIGKSSYFFQKTLFLQREIISEKIKPMLGKIKPDDPKVKEQVERVLCYHIIARVVKTFDASELPKTLRNTVAHEYSKDVVLIREQLFASLQEKVNGYYNTLQIILSDSKKGTSLDNNNKQSNKFYGIS